MKFRCIIGLACALSAWSCGGSGSSGNTTATDPSPTPSASTTVSILGQRGDQSFSPNPAPIDGGANVQWRNADNTTHHIVMNDGSWDSGDLAPGATSQSMRLTGSGGNYHCTIHPTTMFGSINVATTPPAAPPGSGNGY